MGNRGIAHRTVIDDDIDGREFVALLADLVHREEIRVRAFCIMMTHFHLLVETLTGDLGCAMQRLQGIYARGFNRRRPSRNGHLVKARYWCKRVTSDAYQGALFNYFDLNPVVAGLVANPADYPYGSARLYQGQRGPAWLDRSWAERTVCQRMGLTTYSPEGYRQCFGVAASTGRRAWLESLTESSLDAPPNLDDLVRASPPHVIRWLEARAIDADGVGRGAPLADPGSVATIVAEAEARSPGWMLRPGKRPRPAFRLLLVALLRDVAGLSFSQIEIRASILARVAVGLYAEHRRYFKSEVAYRTIAIELASAALQRCHSEATPCSVLS